MGSLSTIDGDLIALAKAGQFDAIAHGCNCFCSMGAGIALQMAKAFNADILSLEQPRFRGDIDKLGRIQFFDVPMSDDESLTIVNCYTQYQPGPNLDYDAVTLCMRKINHSLTGKIIGLPMIGAGIAGGDWDRIESIIRAELKDCQTIIVKYNK